MNKKYIVRLTDEERGICEATIKNEKGKSEKLRRARILLKADADGPGWNDEKISEAVGCTHANGGECASGICPGRFRVSLDSQETSEPPTPKRLDGTGEAKIIATRLGQPPAGYANWTLRLLARTVVELSIVESISHETVRRTLKKVA